LILVFYFYFFFVVVVVIELFLVIDLSVLDSDCVMTSLGFVSLGGVVGVDGRVAVRVCRGVRESGKVVVVAGCGDSMKEEVKMRRKRLEKVEKACRVLREYGVVEMHTTTEEVEAWMTAERQRVAELEIEMGRAGMWRKKDEKDDKVPDKEMMNEGKVQVCMGKACMKQGAELVLADARNSAVPAKCMGRCKDLGVSVRRAGESEVSKVTRWSEVVADEVEKVAVQA